MSYGLSAAEVRSNNGVFCQLQKPGRAQITRVISGEFEFIVGGDTQTPIAGESVAIPAIVASGCFCVAAGILLVVTQRT